MNKYSKRALKTTATVGMSLAMVLSAAAPVMADSTLPTTTCADTDATSVACKDLFFDLNKAITAITLDELTVDSTGKVLNKDNADIIATIINNKDVLLAGNDYSTVKTWTAITDEIAADTEDDETAKGMFSTAYFAATANAATAETGGLVNYYNTQLGSAWSVEEMKKPAVSAVAVKAYEKMNKWIEDGFYDRLDDVLSARFDAVYNDLEERTSGYIVEDSEITRLFVAAWSTVLEQDLSEAGKIKFSAKDATDFARETGVVVDSATIDLSSKAAIKNRITQVKNSPNYYRVKNDSAVLDIIEQYEDLLGTITDLKDLLKDDSYKAFTSTKTDDEDKTVKAFLNDVTYDAKSTTDLKKAKELASKLDLEQYEILKALKEDVLDYAYNFETKKVGNYYVDKSGIVSGFTGNTTVVRDLGGSANAYLLALVDNKEGKFGIDVVLDYMEEFAKASAAATTDIEKITPANIKASDKAKLEAAEDAYYEMKEGDYTGNLTDAQKKELRRVATKIDGLRTAFDNLGTTTATGWYDKGNGNWGFNNEDGTPATKWVAAGSDWYYVKGGNMLRNAWIAENASGARWYYVNDKGVMVTNTVVDGYTIDANGIWTK